MKKYPIILDLETKHTFREFDDPKKLGITVVGIYQYEKEKGMVFEEKELNKLFPILESSSFIIGFNIIDFDLPVLQAYYPGDIKVFSVFDILADIKEKIGRRISLNEVVGATLGKKKTGHGLQAIDLYQEKKIEELKNYCLNDVLLTKEVFDYGVKNGEIFYLTANGKASIKVDWKKYLDGKNKNNIPLTLPF